MGKKAGSTILFIEDGACSFCPHGIQYNHSLISVCYWVEPTRRLFQDQNGYCGNLGGTLAIFRDNETFNYIKSTSGSWLIADEDYWIGIEKNLTSQRFDYIDGSPLTFAQWSPDETDFKHPCVILMNWEMLPQKCTAKLKRGICSKEISTNGLHVLDKTTSVSNTADTSTASQEVTSESNGIVPNLSTTPVSLCTTTKSCTLHCTCLVDNITGVDLEIKLDILKKTLTLMKNSTNAYFRSKISVYENRTSAQGIGILGILVIVVVFLFILSLDFIPLG
ncbi:uncharacterized protein LOC144619150 [Crassostrea virginica]